MEKRSSIRRRFTLGDIAVLIASAGVGLWLSRSYLLNEPNVLAGIGVRRNWWSWAQGAWLVLMPVQLGLLGLSMAPPRPRLRRLARRPGFLAGIAVAAAAATSAVQAAATFHRYIAIGANPSAAWLHNNLIAISAPYRLAPFILLVWAIAGLQGRWHRSHNWVETSARVLGGVWILSWCTYLVVNGFM